MIEYIIIKICKIAILYSNTGFMGLDMSQMNLFLNEQLDNLEKQIREKQKITEHEIREYPVSVIVDKFTDGIEKDEAELFIPDYQREFVWTESQQSRFIESLLLNLPIPYLFVADTNEKDDGRIEIVDGSQRIRTLVRFLEGELVLEGLEKLPAANGLRFTDFPKSRQLRFNRKTLRMIELTEQADEEARREIFDRLNSGGTNLNSMERRFGSSDQPFYVFLLELTKKLAPKNGESLFKTLCPISETRQRRAEYSELLLRFFAYVNDYENFNHRVDEFLESYVDKVDKTVGNFDGLEQEFLNTLKYVEKTFGMLGFRKKEMDTSVPRIRFEALAVGAALALRHNPQLSTKQDLSWLNSKEFIKHTRSDASNSRPKVKARIEYVRDKLLGMSDG